MGKKNLSLAKTGIIYTVSNAVVKGLSFFTTPIFSRLMTKYQYGQFSNISSWINILITIITLDLYSAVSVAKYDYDNNINEYLSSSLLFGNIVTLFFYGLFELKSNWVEKFLGMDRLYIRITFLYLLFYPSVQFLLAKYRIYNEYKNVLIVTWINTMVSVIAQVVLVILLPDKLFGRFLGNYAVVALVDAVFWLSIVIKGRSFSLKYYRHALKLSIPLIPHILSGVLLSSSDRIMINSICGSEKAALYSLAYTISMIASIVLTSINQAWIPWMYDRMHDNKSEIKNTMRIYTELFMLFCIGLMLLGPEAVLVFGGKSYFSSRYVIAPVVFALMLQFIYTQYVNIEFYRKKNIFISLATVVATVINILLNYWLLPICGYIVAAYTTIVGYLIMVITHYLIVRVVLKEQKIYDCKCFIFSGLLTFVIMILSLISYDKLLLRILMIIMYIFALIIWILKKSVNIRSIKIQKK